MIRTSNQPCAWPKLVNTFSWQESTTYVYQSKRSGAQTYVCKAHRHNAFEPVFGLIGDLPRQRGKMPGPNRVTINEVKQMDSVGIGP